MNRNTNAKVKLGLTDIGILFGPEMNLLNIDNRVLIVGFIYFTGLQFPDGTDHSDVSPLTVLRYF